MLTDLFHCIKAKNKSNRKQNCRRRFDWQRKIHVLIQASCADLQGSRETNSSGLLIINMNIKTPESASCDKSTRHDHSRDKCKMRWVQPLRGERFSLVVVLQMGWKTSVTRTTPPLKMEVTQKLWRSSWISPRPTPLQLFGTDMFSVLRWCWNVYYFKLYYLTNDESTTNSRRGSQKK